LVGEVEQAVGTPGASEAGRRLTQPTPPPDAGGAGHQDHNLKVVGSNPAPVTNFFNGLGRHAMVW
jgi:hypothetical protein